MLPLSHLFSYFYRLTQILEFPIPKLLNLFLFLCIWLLCFL
nr:MAG TPA: hypothetical protein [Caudoviricetes sp.]